jgi:hypothetical protein
MRNMSMSPSLDMGASGMGRHGDVQQYMQTGPLPVHMRVASPVPSSGPSYTTGMRPTSHPTGYGPPSTLEPSIDQHQPAAPSSNGGSPHMGNVGWQSPSHMPSANAQHAANYAYPDPADYPPNAAAMNQMYYGTAPQMRRPQSAEPGMVHMA